MVAWDDDNVVIRLDVHVTACEQTCCDPSEDETVSGDPSTEASAKTDTLARLQVARLWEEALQPLTAAVARAEVIQDLIQADELPEIPAQLAKMEDHLQRLLSLLALTRATVDAHAPPVISIPPATSVRPTA